jgi:hypothetical protein
MAPGLPSSPLRRSAGNGPYPGRRHHILAANRRQLSLVDCASFAAMRQSGFKNAFVFDRHFLEQGSTLLK